MSGTVAHQEGRTTGARVRLASWKEIGTYLKRGVRTVRRWEHQEGLPVHRHPHSKQATVYAFTDEIDRWLERRSVGKNANELPLDQAQQPAAEPALEAWQREPHDRPVVIAVLPLRNLGEAREGDRFADGLTEELILEIGHASPKRLCVIALTSVLQYKQPSKSIAQIGQELGADYVLEGSIRRYGRRVRLTARLIAAHDQAHVWTDSYEIQLPPIFSLQQALARQVADALSAELRAKPEKGRHKAAAPNFAAHSAFLEGSSHFLQTEGDTQKSLEYLNLAIQRDPKFALSYAKLAQVYFRRLFWDYPPVETCRRVKENAEKALKLDPKLARAHSMLGAFYLFGAWEWAKAERSTRRAIKLNPSDPWAHIIRASYHLVVGAVGESVNELKLVRQLDPQSQETGIWFAHCAYFARRYDLAIEHGQEIVKLDPSSAFVHMILGLNFVQIGESARAIGHCEKAIELGADSVSLMSRACSIYALAGERQRAEGILQELVAAQETKYVRYVFLAQAAVRLGKDKQTFEWLDEAYEQRDPMLVLLRTDPRFDSISAVPRFRNLLRRIGLPREAARLASAQTA